MIPKWFVESEKREAMELSASIEEVESKIKFYEEELCKLREELPKLQKRLSAKEAEIKKYKAFNAVKQFCNCFIDKDDVAEFTIDQAYDRFCILYRSICDKEYFTFLFRRRMKRKGRNGVFKGYRLG